MLLTGDSEFDQEVWINLAKNVNHSLTKFSLASHESCIPKNIKIAKKLLVEEGGATSPIQLSGFFPTDKVEAFVAMTRYGLIRFYFVFIILHCLSERLVSVSIEEQEYSYKCLFKYFNMNSFKHNLPHLLNFGKSNNRNELSVNECKKFDSYIDICVETVANFLSNRLHFDQATNEKLKNLMVSLLKFLDCEDKKPEDNSGLFHLFEKKLINLMNANAICLANNIPIAAVGDAGDTLTFSTNQFLESYRKEMLRLIDDMTHIDQASLRELIGNKSFLNLLNRFPIRINH